MATWVSNGADTGGSGSYSPGTQSVQYCHDNFAANGDTITIPNGTYNWSNGATITKQITLSGSGPSNVHIQNQMTSGYGLHMTSGTTGHSYLKGIHFLQIANNGGGAGFQVALDRQDTSSPGNLYTVVVTNCSFDSGTVFNYGCLVSANGIIFSGCSFLSQSTSGLPLCGLTLVCGKYGFTGSWNTPSTMGSLDTTGLNNTYVEDSTFTNGVTACTNADDNARFVVRHCTITDSQISGHGQDTSVYGVRHHEVYNCSFVYSNPTGNLNNQCWCGFRGGVALVANNTMDLIGGKPSISLSCQNINRGASVGGCQTGYPANRQIGSGWSASSSVPYGNPVVTQDGTGYILDPCYFFGDTGPGGQGYGSYVSLNQYTPDNCGNGLLVSNFIQLNRDYYVGTSRPGWTPYTYPHPLVSGSPIIRPVPSALVTPLASVNARVLGTVRVTPSALVTPLASVNARVLGNVRVTPSALVTPQASVNFHLLGPTIVRPLPRAQVTPLASVNFELLGTPRPLPRAQVAPVASVTVRLQGRAPSPPPVQPGAQPAQIRMYVQGNNLIMVDNISGEAFALPLSASIPQPPEYSPTK